MTENKPKFKQSETIVIKRSQINFAPYNPKKHSAEAIHQQKMNFKRVGFLGGIVWNKTTGNLISGHKRTMAMDAINKYDGTPETDYDIKVEMVEVDENTEKEQNIYMDASGTNTAQDFDLISAILPDIDFHNAGLTETDLALMGADFSNSLPSFEASEELNEMDEIQKKAKKDKIKEAKSKIKKDIEDSFGEGDPLLVLSFDSFAAKQKFMRRFDLDSDVKFIKGEIFSTMIERIE